MSKKTAVERFAAEVLKYKNPTNLNGTDYIMISINKVEYLKEQAEEMEKQQIIDAIDYYKKRPYCEMTPEQYYNETYQK